MRKVTYIAVLEPSSDGYGVYFPDLPGCVTFGETVEAAIELAEEALSLHIYGMEKDGDTIPAPSKSPKVDPETEPGYMLSPITIFPDLVAQEMDNRRVKTNVTIPAWVKELAAEKGLNCSRLLETAILDAAHVKRVDVPTTQA